MWYSNTEEIVDGLIDLCVVAIGTLDPCPSRCDQGPATVAVVTHMVEVGGGTAGGQPVDVQVHSKLELQLERLVRLHEYIVHDYAKTLP